ncbi:unnamed protein product [Cunninghamella blakesleeana]
MLNSISSWKITNILSVKLKRYEIIDHYDLRNKARLLLHSSFKIGRHILPSFATNHNTSLRLGEIDYVDLGQRHLVKFFLGINLDDEQFIDDYRNEHGTIFKQNLTDI